MVVHAWFMHLCNYSYIYGWYNKSSRSLYCEVFLDTSKYCRIIQNWIPWIGFSLNVDKLRNLKQPNSKEISSNMVSSFEYYSDYFNNSIIQNLKA